MEFFIIIILLLLGISFLLLEIFFLPGVSIAGIAGVLFTGGAVFYAYSYIGMAAGHISLLAAVVLLGIAIWMFVRSKALDKLSLTTDIDSKNDPLKDITLQLGDTGTTVSRLAPMGKIKINGHVVEAKTNGGFIDEGVSVVVLEVFNTNVLVEQVAD